MWVSTIFDDCAWRDSCYQHSQPVKYKDVNDFGALRFHSQGNTFHRVKWINSWKKKWMGKRDSWLLISTLAYDQIPARDMSTINLHMCLKVILCSTSGICPRCGTKLHLDTLTSGKVWTYTVVSSVFVSAIVQIATWLTRLTKRPCYRQDRMIGWSLLNPHLETHLPPLRSPEEFDQRVSISLVVGTINMKIEIEAVGD